MRLTDAMDALAALGVPYRQATSGRDALEILLDWPTKAKDGTSTHHYTVTLLPQEGDSWRLLQVVGAAARQCRNLSLDAAVRLARALQRDFRLSEPCSCGAEREFSFGETLEPRRQFLSYTSTHCRACGHITEGDGDELSEDLRAIECRRQGTWTVCVDKSLSVSALHTLRVELELSLPALARLRATLPGPVFTGTHGEARRCSGRLRRAGVGNELAMVGDDSGWEETRTEDG